MRKSKIRRSSGVTLGNVGKSEDSKTDEERRDHDEEKLCKSIVKGLARRIREKHVILAEVGKEDQRVLCIDDVKDSARRMVTEFHESWRRLGTDRVSEFTFQMTSVSNQTNIRQ